jgi:Ca-activated chloride channel family protein
VAGPDAGNGAPGAAPQRQAAPPGPVFEDEVAVSWVLVPVVVRSSRGFVEDLTVEDFRLWVDGRRVAIESFDSSTDVPLSLVWLQDLSGSMANGGKLAAGRRALELFLTRSQPSDTFALATFAGGRLEVEVPFTSDRQALREAADRWRGWGTTSLHDAVAWVPEVSAEGPHPRRAAVLVTDGVDNASVIQPAAARMLVRRARLPVYVLGMTAAELPEGGADGDPIYRYAHLLEQLARTSGGRFFSVTDPESLETAAAAVHDELRHQYVLGFPAQTAGSRRWRRIRVEIAGHRKAELLVRQGYRGGAPVGSESGP